jgi:primosomal replication protein N
MHMAWNENHISLVGYAGGDAQPSHETHGISYFRFPLRVSRLSGTEDVLNVLVARSLLEQCPVEKGTTLTVEGEVRSYNNRSGTGSKLVIAVFARALAPGGEEHKNQLTLAGVLCKPPVVRRTPLGREICDLLLAVNRRYGRADYLPCIAWGALAAWCGQLQVGDPLKLNGRLQSREYTKEENGQSTRRTAFEASILSLEPVELDT